MKNLAIPIGIFILAVIAGVAVMIIPGPSKAPVNNGNATTTPITPAEWPKTYKTVLEVAQPTITKTQIVLTGRAAGWYFEASFPVEVRNASGTLLVQHYAQAQGDWMTASFVPFVSTITIPPQPAGSQGTIIFRKDNPSGLPENDDSYSLPITFQ